MQDIKQQSAKKSGNQEHAHIREIRNHRSNRLKKQLYQSLNQLHKSQHLPAVAPAPYGLRSGSASALRCPNGRGYAAPMGCLVPRQSPSLPPMPYRKRGRPKGAASDNRGITGDGGGGLHPHRAHRDDGQSR